MSGYYIQLFSIHGLIRFKDPEIGRDRDTGGQVKYVLELLEHLSSHPHVRKIDLFTRRIEDKRVSSSYGQRIEKVNEKARIVRIDCGGNAYRSKESLWDNLDEFVDKTIRFIEKEDDFPDVVHGHYADGNYVARELSEVFGVPFIATGHSLGRNKKNILLNDGWTEGKINEKFNIEKRIAVEESVLKRADVIVVSTNTEIKAQYGSYNNKAEGRFEVIPPGINNELFYPFYRSGMPGFNMTLEQEQALYRINSEIERFLFNTAKPLILSIGRADKRKNFERIIQAYGQDKELQALANLAIFAGVRKDITEMPPEEQELLTNLLLLLDKYDLYGKMAIPKKNDPRLEVPEIYRIAARKKGVFVNATPGENFGLTVVEAASCGLPVIASNDGGPKEILKLCENGLLVDAEDPTAIAGALRKIVSDEALWEKFSANGIRNTSKRYTWKAHSNQYVETIQNLFTRKDTATIAFTQKGAYGKRLAKIKWFIISDLDGTLVDGDNVEGLADFTNWIMDHKDQVIFGLASGRNKDVTQQALATYDLPEPDLLICSAGSEIYYTKRFIPDNGWESHINWQWKRSELQNALTKFPGIRLQEAEAQWPFKLSYFVEESFNRDQLSNLYKFLDDQKLRAKVLLTQNRYLDLLPFRAGKGNAVRYLSYKWNAPIEGIITAGNSGNDIDMLKGRTKGIVVANYSPELEELRKSRFVYFAGTPLAKGVLEGIKHYMMLNEKRSISDTLAGMISKN